MANLPKRIGKGVLKYLGERMGCGDAMKIVDRGFLSELREATGLVALKQAREPTDEMIRAGAAVIQNDRIDPAAVWRAMADAVITGKEPTP